MMLAICLAPHIPYKPGIMDHLVLLSLYSILANLQQSFPIHVCEIGKPQKLAQIWL